MKKRDIILIGSILAAAFTGWMALRFFGGLDGAAVRITVDGEEYGTWPLEEDAVIDVDTEYGHNRVHIQSGNAYMEEADCPDGYCKRQGKIHTRAESIICLPHKLVVEVLDESVRQMPGTGGNSGSDAAPEDDGLDAVSK